MLAIVTLPSLAKERSDVRDMSTKITVVDGEGTQWGPYEEAEVRGYLEAGNFTPESWAMREGDADWSPLGELLQPAPPVPVPEPAPIAVPSAVNPNVAPTERTPLIKPDQQKALAAQANPTPTTPQVTPAASPSLPAAAVAPQQVKAPQIEAAKVPAAASGAANPRAAASTEEKTAKKDPLAMPILGVGVVLAVVGLVLLYLSPANIIYASPLVILGVVGALYAIMRGLMVPGLAAMLVIVFAAGGIGYLSVTSQQQRKVEAKVAKQKAKEAKEEADIKKFAEEANEDINIERQRVIEAIQAVVDDPNDDNWMKAEVAIEAYQQAMRVAGVAKGSVKMRAANKLRQAIMDQDEAAITVSLEELEKQLKQN